MSNNLLHLYQRANATAYEKRRDTNPKWQFENESLTRVLQDHQSEIKSVIDAPVGTGRFLGFYPRILGDVAVCGLDESEDMLAIAREKAGRQSMELRKQDIINHPLEMHADLVVCYRFLNLVPWEDAAKSLRNLIAATGKFLVVSIRTVADDHPGELFIEDKIHLHRRSALDALVREQGLRVRHTAIFEQGSRGEYSVITFSPAEAIHESRVNRNFRLIYTYGRTAQEKVGKIYEVKDAEHARFIRTVTNGSALQRHFPRIVGVDDNFVNAEWAQGDLLPVHPWHRPVELLVQVQYLPVTITSSFDYVEDWVIPRFHKALPLLGRAWFDKVVRNIRDRSMAFDRRLCHPDVVPGNVVASEGRLILIDNEFLCRSRHHRLDILNLLHNLGRMQRSRALGYYLQLTRTTLDEWEEHREYLNHVWFARKIGSALVRNRLDRVHGYIRESVNGENILPYDVNELRELLSRPEVEQFGFEDPSIGEPAAPIAEVHASKVGGRGHMGGFRGALLRKVKQGLRRFSSAA